MPNLQAKWHGLPVWAWGIGGITLGASALILYRRRAANAAAAASGSVGGATMVPYDPNSPGGASGGSGGSSGDSSTGQEAFFTKIQKAFADFQANVLQQQQAFEKVQQTSTQDFLKSQTTLDQTQQSAWQSFLANLTKQQENQQQTEQTFLQTLAARFESSPNAPVVGAGNPADQYHLGQVVNAGSGEKIVNSVFSPVYGWLNETNLGGIYTGGGGSKGIGDLQYGGSYLGYAASRPDPNAEIGQHGHFTGLTLLPGGGYTEINDRGERYTFGA